MPDLGYAKPSLAWPVSTPTWWKRIGNPETREQQRNETSLKNNNRKWPWKNLYWSRPANCERGEGLTSQARPATSTKTRTVVCGAHAYYKAVARISARRLFLARQGGDRSVTSKADTGVTLDTRKLRPDRTMLTTATETLKYNQLKLMVNLKYLLYYHNMVHVYLHPND